MERKTMIPNKFTGHVVDVVGRRMMDGIITVEKGRIVAIEAETVSNDAPYFIPGFVDAHIHIESSMLTPSAFARLAVRSGTVAVAADPHEIANVMGQPGVDFMIEDGQRVPFKFYFGAPSCVPATPFETSGARLDAAEVGEMMKRNDIYFLGEMMNYPGVVMGDEEVKKKIQTALACGKPVDGHAPYLSGDDLRRYVAAGISTDHECSTEAEAREKMALGMKILIREGSAARNFDALIGVMKDHADDVMFCSDDKHPDSLMAGHINVLARRAVAKGYDAMDVLRACSLNPVRHYKMNVGLLQVGDPADFAVVDNLHDFNVISTVIEGCRVYDAKYGYCNDYENLEASTDYHNHFEATEIEDDALRIKAGKDKLHVIDTEDGSLVTTELLMEPKVENGWVTTDVERDILKLVVYNRYTAGAQPQVAFVRGFGLRCGAIASTIAHDSHNIIAVGTNDEDIATAINQVIEMEGGIVVGKDEEWQYLELPIAGLMSEDKGESVASQYAELNAEAGRMGASYAAPFMTLSFMALLVIPELKLSDKGLFDSKRMKFIRN